MSAGLGRAAGNDVSLGCRYRVLCCDLDLTPVDLTVRRRLRFCLLQGKGAGAWGGKGGWMPPGTQAGCRWPHILQDVSKTKSQQRCRTKLHSSEICIQCQGATIPDFRKHSVKKQQKLKVRGQKKMLCGGQD